MAYPLELKHELVLCLKYRRLLAVWSQADDQPVVRRLPTKDCSQEYREPQLLGNIQDGYVEIRLYDDEGIDITNEPSLLGDWTNAMKQCEVFLESEAKIISGFESDCVRRAT